MQWIEVLAIIGTNVFLFLWVRSESRSDQRNIEALITAIQQEMKDFHGRLCAIEERNRSNK